MSDERPPIRVFFSYSHADDRHRLRLEKALKLLEREGLIDTWTDRKLLPGDRWEEGIEQELERADLILFLVSDDFIASEFIWGREMKRALEREEKGEARVVPVIVRPCDWQPAPFGKLQAVPMNGLAVTDPEWGNEDKAWEDVAKRLRALIEGLVARQGARPAGDCRGSSPPLWADPTRYLEAIASRNSYVEIRGIGAQAAEQLPLKRVYIRLRVASAGHGEREEESSETRSLQGTELELSEVLRLSRNAVLIGDPGSGKTTVLRFAAHILARARLTGDPDIVAHHLGLGADSAEKSPFLMLDLETGSAEEIPFPILVRLSRFAEFLADHPHDSCPEDAPEHLLRYLEFDLKGRTLGLPDDYLRRRVTSGGCFLLLDGLDEVPGPLRTRVASIVEELVATASTEPPNWHLITCRTRAYRGLFQLGGLPAYPLAPFDERQVIAFVHGWSQALFSARRREDGESAQEDAEAYEAELLEAIRSHENVGPMTKNPLMLTMLAVVHWNQKKFPERRNELYEEAVKYLLESRKDYSSFPPPQRREALQALALAMFTDEEGVQRSLGLPEASRAVAPVLQVGDEEARDFLDDEALQSGLLVSRMQGEVEFWHLSFQEYLAALELATSGDYWEILSEDGRLHDDRWSEVVLLLAGCIRRLGGLRAARGLLEKILATGTGRVSRARAVGLVGRVLADIMPYGGDPSLGTEYPTALEKALAIFQPPANGEQVVDEAVRVEVGDALGQAGDPRLARPSENWVAIPGGTFWMGAQNHYQHEPGYDSEAFNREFPVHRPTVSPFVLGRFPVTVQEFRQFVDAGDEGYLGSRCWDPEGWAWRERGEYTEPGSWRDQVRHPNWPVTEVSWYEADAYCRWVGGRLPTEAEWELAARGEEGRRYAWGKEKADNRRANFNMRLGKPTAVGVYPLGLTPEGVHDLLGNVWEWCGDRFAGYFPKDEEDPTGTPSGASRVLRGGSFRSFSWNLRGSSRFDLHPRLRYDDVGFRVSYSPSRGPESRVFGCGPRRPP